MGKQKPSLGLALLINVLSGLIALLGGIQLATFEIDIPKPAVDVWLSALLLGIGRINLNELLAYV